MKNDVPKTGFCAFCGEPFLDKGNGTRLPFCSFNCRRYYYMDEKEFAEVVKDKFYNGDYDE
ncbi:MAG: hypothetical protein H8E10_10645 [Desulfobacterales bacterium]|nr:hypothetical protein [Desulfobacterales bacterium]